MNEQRVRAQCPYCGNEEFGTNEDLTGTADLVDGAIWLVGDPSYPDEQYEHGGTTEIDYDSSVTIGYVCMSCHVTIGYGELVPAGPKEE